MQINISNEILAELGKITVLFGLMEASLGEIIGRIITVGGRRRELGVIVTAELAFKQRVSAVNSLLLLALGKDNEVVAQFDRVKPLLFQAEQERNTIVHSVWAKDAEAVDPHAVIRMKATTKPRHGLRTEFVAMSLEDLQQTTALLATAYGELSLFELHFHGDSEDDPSEAEE
jgi:hypothetical protein